jgi:hypothetical protein
MVLRLAIFEEQQRLLVAFLRLAIIEEQQRLPGRQYKLLVQAFANEQRAVLVLAARARRRRPVNYTDIIIGPLLRVAAGVDALSDASCRVACNGHRRQS